MSGIENMAVSRRGAAVCPLGGTAPRLELDAFVKSPAASDTGINGQILLIVNPPELGELLAFCLTAAGFRARRSLDAGEGVQEVKRFAPDLLLLDSKAPDFGSTDIWREIRTACDDDEREPAVVMLIRGEHDIDPRLGLEFGPCDFVLYPFGVRDLVLRIDGIIRTRHAGAAGGVVVPRRRYQIGPLDVDVGRHTAMVAGASVHLSALEMRLLVYMIERRGRVCSRAALLTDVCGYHPDVTTRADDVHVTRLRGKLGPAAGLIETVRGAGYRLSGEFPIVDR